MKTLILASTSPRRKEILANLGIPFEVEASPYQEDMNLNLPPHELAKHLSKEKAKAVAKHHTNAIVIGADTFVVFEGKLLGKPRSPEEAKDMLQDLSNKANSVLTGITIIDSDTNQTHSEVFETKVYMKKMSPKEIEGYVASGEPLDKAGAYTIHALGAVLIDKIEGDFFAVMGLPIRPLTEIIKEFGINIWNERKVKL
jgi:septum formation protein